VKVAAPNAVVVLRVDGFRSLRVDKVPLAATDTLTRGDRGFVVGYVTASRSLRRRPACHRAIATAPAGIISSQVRIR
jgi:hypothetical protein